MNDLLARQLDELLNASQQETGLGCESVVRVGAATLVRGDDITSTTVVVSAGQDDGDALEAFVSDIAEEFGLEAATRRYVGSLSVRFTRRPVPAAEAAEREGAKGLLARFIPRRRQVSQGI